MKARGWPSPAPRSDLLSSHAVTEQGPGQADPQNATSPPGKGRGGVSHTPGPYSPPNNDTKGRCVRS